MARCCAPTARRRVRRPVVVTGATGFVDRQLAETLPPAEYLAARRAGAALSSDELVAYVSALADGLVAG